MIKKRIIHVVSEFYPKPKWRYIHEGEGSGEDFRKRILAGALRDNDLVIVDLNGFNRYGPSFISESFGELIRVEGFSRSELKRKLRIEHDKLQTVVDACWAEIDKAAGEIK